MFWSYYVAWPCDLDLLTLRVFCDSASHVRHTYQFLLLCYDYRLLSYEYWISDHISIICNSHCMRRVTWPLTRGKNSPHFWNPWPQVTHFHGATTKIKPCYGSKMAFSHYESYKVYCACAVSRELCIGGPPKPHVTIFWLQIADSLYNFYGATMTIKGSFILEHPHVKAVFGRKKNCPVKIGPRDGGFSEI